jgi:hypothetical protein
MGDVASARECEPAGRAALPGHARAFARAARNTFLASWQTLTGFAWLAGRITRRFGGYYARTLMARLAGRPSADSHVVPRFGKAG